MSDDQQQRDQMDSAQRDHEQEPNTPTPGDQAVPPPEDGSTEVSGPRPGEKNPASEASGDPKATAAPSVLDDPRSIEDGPETERRIGLGKISPEERERLQREGRKIELDPVSQVAYEILPVPARDHAAGQLQQGSPEKPEKPEPEPPIDRAGGVPQQGTIGDPDPTSLNSGMKASEIAAVAYGTVQSYKRQVAQESFPWLALSERTQTQITAFVCQVMSEGIGGPAANHEVWRKNRLEAGVTVADDPRVGLPWGDLEPVERRKSMIFTQVVMALLREV